ncbi:MAG: ATP-binding protein [Thermodesulfovibrionales bacterium]|nr:ATP-binding protein [Thermodesulfovibrionales bacterium]
MGKDGSKILLEVSSKAIDIAGELYVQSLHRDITEKKKLQEQLYQSQKMESIGTLAGGIAHDFNNVLSGILGRTELLLFRNDLATAAKQHIRSIENAARKAGAIVQRLLSFARKGNFEMLPVNLNDIINDAIELTASMAIKRKVEIRKEIDDTVPVINGDANQLEQVMMNLIVNAMDAMPDGGTITISTNLLSLKEKAGYINPLLSDGEYFVLKISDTGAGIPDGIRDRIFEPFFTTKEQGKGTGLGLAMVYGIIKEHKGLIDVNSEIGKGTTFEIYLPVYRAISIEPGKRSAPSTESKKNILVIDDEEYVLNYIKEILDAKGYKVFVTDNPIYAFDMFKEIVDSVSVVITDIVMPILDGRELVKQFKAVKPSVQIIAISGHDISAKEDKNIDAFITKPFTRDVLVAAVDSALRAEVRQI